jgi:hypothetical protein
MQIVIPGLYASAPEQLPFAPSLEIRAFLLQREQGNLLVYNVGTLPADSRSIEELGGISRRYLNHWHEALFGCDRVARSFKAPLFATRMSGSRYRRRARSPRRSPTATCSPTTFEVIPTPGHTSGATAFLWHSGEHRYLFTGDTIYFRDGDWIAAVLESSESCCLPREPRTDQRPRFRRARSVVGDRRPGLPRLYREGGYPAPPRRSARALTPR